MTNCVKYLSQPHRSTSVRDSSLSNLSQYDLDDMFTTNLRLLQDLEEEDARNPTNRCGKSFQSSLNIYINPRNGTHPNPTVEYSNCDIISVRDKRARHTKNPKTSNRLYQYSSYETLYDDYVGKEKDERKWECMSQSMIESSIDNDRKFGSYVSIDSDKTLQSYSSDDYSQISNQNPDGHKLKISRSNQSLPNCSAISKEDTRVRPNGNGMLSRPVSYHMDGSAGNYLNKPPSHPFGNVGEGKLHSPANVVISRSMKNSFPTPYYDGRKKTDFDKNMDFHRNIDCSANLSISSRNISLMKKNNIINNHVTSAAHSSSGHRALNNSDTNLCVMPPVVPPRNREIGDKEANPRNNNKSSSKKSEQHQRQMIDEPIKEPRFGQRRQNGTRSQSKVQNYDNDFLSSSNHRNPIPFYKFSDI